MKYDKENSISIEESKSWLSEKISKHDRSLAQQPKERKKWPKLTESEINREILQQTPKEFQNIVKKYF